MGHSDNLQESAAVQAQLCNFGEVDSAVQASAGTPVKGSNYAQAVGLEV